jgi:uncharacterized protein (DUF58 family)
MEISARRFAARASADGRHRLYQRIADYLWVFKTTPAGKCLVVGFVISASLGSASLDMPLYHLVCALGAAGLVAFVVGLLFRPRVQVQGGLPAHAVAGQPVTTQFRLTNAGRWPAFDLSLGLFPLAKGIRQELRDGVVTRLGRSETATVHLTIEPLRRGFYTLPDLYPYSVFPFNVFRSACRPQPPSPLLVYPAFPALSTLVLPRVRRYQPGGLVMTSRVGESSEYIGSREYRPGDSTRDLDFRSWARLARPVVREYQEEYFCRIALILDTYVATRGRRPVQGYAQLEAAISLTAAVADVLARGEDVIDLFAAGPTLHIFRAGRRTAHLGQVLEILAGVEECRTDPCEELAPVLAQELASLSAAVCIFLDWDGPRRRLVQEMAESGCAVKVLLVRDRAPSVSMAPEEEEEFLATVLAPEQIRAGQLEIV